MTTNFRTTRRLLAPRWLTEGEGRLVGYALDLVKDVYVERVRLGHLARFPQNGPLGQTAPDDALAAQGRDRKLLRGISETAAAYALRLIAWLDDHRSKGTAFMMMKQLAAYCGAGFSFRIYDVRGNCYSRDEDGAETYDPATGWDWDTETDRWSRFWVIVYPGPAWAAGSNLYADAGTPDYGPNLGQWGVDIPREQITSARAIVTEWKPAGTRCVHIIVAFDPASFDPASPEPDGTWGGWAKIQGGQYVPARLATAKYLKGSDLQ